MIAYISLSVSQRDLYIYTFLSKILIDKGFYVLSNFNVNKFNKSETIKKSNLFYGIILENGPDHNAVISDYKIAQSKSITSFILTERDINITRNDSAYNNIIKIDKRNYRKSLEYLNQHINNIVVPKVNQKRHESTFMLLAGAAGAIALLSILENESKKKKKRRN
jgi:hypothetical protein